VGLAVALAAFLGYSSCLDFPFVFDDLLNINVNHSIRSLWPISFDMPPGSTVDGRPLLNYTFAVNYALGGLAPRGYHLVNVVIHALSALTLLGIVRRTLLSPRLIARFGERALPLAFAVSLTWSVHPLLAQSVTYISQRAESLGGLCYLLTIYCLARGEDSEKPALWHVGSVAACFLGSGVKEILATAPLVALFYDRAFYSGSFNKAVQLRPKYYLMLFSSWAILAALMSTSGSRNNTIGFQIGHGWFSYLQTQAWAIARYLRMTLWPTGFTFDYGELVVPGVEALPSLAFVSLLFLATCFTTAKNRPEGFAGLWFFIILAPTSSFIPIAPTVEEHRMYLPLAGVVSLVVIGAYGAWKSYLPERNELFLLLALAIACAGLSFATVARNRVYSSPLSLWEDTASQAPKNASARINYGTALLDVGRLAEARTQYEYALSIDPDSCYVCANVALGRWLTGDPTGAEKLFQKALSLDPDSEFTHFNYAVMLMETGRPEQALVHFNRAIIANPKRADSYTALGVASGRLGEIATALGFFKKALQLDPYSDEAYYNRGNLLLKAGRTDEAVGNYTRAIELNGLCTKCYANLGEALFQVGQPEEGIAAYTKALELEPANANVHRYFAVNLKKIGNLKEARYHDGEAARLGTGTQKP